LSISGVSISDGSEESGEAECIWSIARIIHIESLLFFAFEIRFASTWGLGFVYAKKKGGAFGRETGGRDGKKEPAPAASILSKI
jgi:hypothetical protein